MAPVIPAKAGIQRARQRSAHGAEGCASSFQRMAPSFQRRLESSVRDSGAHTGRRGAPRRSSAWPPSFQRRLESSVRDSGSAHGAEGCVRRSRAGPVVPAKAPSFQRRLESRQGMRVSPCPGEGAASEGRTQPYIVIGALIPINPSVRDSAVCAASASFSRAFISDASAGSAESTRQWS